MRIKCLFALLLAGACASVVAQQNPPERVRKFAALPEWNGIWETELSAQLNSGELDKVMGEAARHPERNTLVLAPPGVLAPAEVAFLGMMQLHGKPPYNSAWERAYERSKRRIMATPASAVRPDSIKACSWGFPMIMETPTDGVFELLVTPEETLLLFADGEVRHIYTDRPHPPKEDLWPTDLGNSVGRWEGDTLVIDTIERKSGPFIHFPYFLSPDLSEQAHFIERLRRTGPNAMQEEMIIEDPTRLAHPWHLTLKFRRVTNLDRLIPTDCTENNRFGVDSGRLTITPR